MTSVNTSVKKKTIRERINLVKDTILENLEDLLAFGFSGGAIIAASGNYPPWVVFFLTLASISKAIPSLIQEWRQEKRVGLEDVLLLVLALCGILAYFGLQNLDWSISLAIAGIISKTALPLTPNKLRMFFQSRQVAVTANVGAGGVAENTGPAEPINENQIYIRKFRISAIGLARGQHEDILPLCLVTVGVFIFFSTGDPAPNWGLLLSSSSLVAKTVSSSMMWKSPLLPITGSSMALIVLGSGIAVATAVSPLILVAGTGCDGNPESNFRVPVTVGFYLSGGPENLIKKDKKWHFLGRSNLSTDSRLTVQSYLYDNNTYHKYPPNGTRYYDVWVEIGQNDLQGKFKWEQNSTLCHVFIHPQPKQQDLYFLNNNPGQWQGYIVQGDSVGYYVSLHRNTLLTWNWNDDNENDGGNLIKTHKTNPSHKYSKDGIYTANLMAGDDPHDLWDFPVLVIPPLSINGILEVSGSNGSKLFRSNDLLSFSFKTQNNSPNLKKQQEDEQYSWVIGNNTQPFCNSSSTTHQKFPISGKFLVKVTVMDSKCAFPLWISSKAITVLDRPAITLVQSNNEFGGKLVTVNGIGFPPEDYVQVTMDNKPPGFVTLTDSIGHFNTTAFSIQNFRVLSNHTVIAISLDTNHVMANKTITIMQ